MRKFTDCIVQWNLLPFEVWLCALNFVHRTDRACCNVVLFAAAGKLKVLPQINLTPEMHVAFNTLHVAGMLRVTLTPIMQVINHTQDSITHAHQRAQPHTVCRVFAIHYVRHLQDVPFVGGVSLSWLEMPMIDFDVR